MRFSGVQVSSFMAPMRTVTKVWRRARRHWQRHLRKNYEDEDEDEDEDEEDEDEDDGQWFASTRVTFTPSESVKCEMLLWETVDRC